MSTTIEPLPASTAPESKGILATIGSGIKELASLPARHRYRQSVFDGTMPDEAVLVAARRIKAEWQRDRAVYLARNEAARALAEDCPRLQAAAEKLAAELQGTQTEARSPVPDSTSIGELRAKILAVFPKARVGTYGELAAALGIFTNTAMHGHLAKLKSKVRTAQEGVTTAKARAERVLFETAAVVTPDGDEGLRRRIERLHTSIADKGQKIVTERQVADATSLCEQAAQGDVEPVAVGLPPATGRGMVFRHLRRQLDDLLDLATGRVSLEKQVAADQAELRDLESRLAAARAAQLERMTDPRNMRWYGDE